MISPQHHQNDHADDVIKKFHSDWIEPLPLAPRIWWVPRLVRQGGVWDVFEQWRAPTLTHSSIMVQPEALEPIDFHQAWQMITRQAIYAAVILGNDHPLVYGLNAFNFALTESNPLSSTTSISRGLLRKRLWVYQPTTLFYSCIGPRLNATFYQLLFSFRHEKCCYPVQKRNDQNQLFDHFSYCSITILITSSNKHGKFESSWLSSF